MKKLFLITLAALALSAQAQNATNITISVVVTVTDIKGNPTSSDQIDLAMSSTAVNGFNVVLGKDQMLAQQQTNPPPTLIFSAAAEVKSRIAPPLEAIALADELKRNKVATLPDVYAKFSDADKQAVAAIVAKYAP